MKLFVNGKVVGKAKAKLSVFDRGFLYGDGLFETMRSYGGKVFRLDRHLERLCVSAKIINLKIPLARAELKKAVYRLLRVNKLKNAYIRLAVSRGEGRVGLDATTAKSSNIVIIAKPFFPYPKRYYELGLKVAVSCVTRNEGSVLSRVKSLNYLNNIMARIEVQKQGFDDAILLNNKGNVACGAVSNIFLIKKNTLLTPSVQSGILPGITRETIIRLAPKAGLKVREGGIGLSTLLGAEEAFFTNTLMEVMPVVSINKKRIGNGRVGERARRLKKIYSTPLDIG